MYLFLYLMNIIRGGDVWFPIDTSIKVLKTNIYIFAFHIPVYQIGYLKYLWRRPCGDSIVILPRN